MINDLEIVVRATNTEVEKKIIKFLQNALNEAFPVAEEKGD